MAVDITPTNEVRGEFGLKRARGIVFKDVVLALCTAIFVWCLGRMLFTQWLARRLAYQPELGEALLTIREIPVFGMWAASDWLGALAASPASDALQRSAATVDQLTYAFGFLAGAAIIARRRRRATNRADELHGSARWAKAEDIARAGLLAPQGIIVGMWEDPKSKRARWLRHNGPEHVLMYAPTGSGKGVGVVLPTLLTWNESAIILDLKGENFAFTSGYRASLGHNVFKLDFAAPVGETARFNPLDAVRMGTSQEVADVQRIARMLADPDGTSSSSNSKHWTDNAAALLAGAMLHVLYREKAEGRRANLAQVLHELTHPAKSHAQTLREWLTHAHDPKGACGWVDTDNTMTVTHPLIAAAARAQLNREQAERSGILSSAVTPLQLFLDPLLAANTACSDFDISDLMDADRPTSVYLVARAPDINRLRPIMRLLLDLWIRRLVEKMEFIGGRAGRTHKHKLLLMMDEFPTLGRMDIIREALAYIRGWGIVAVLITQDEVQLRENYGRDESITSNCHLRLALAPNHMETAKLLSALTGTSTAIRQSRQRSMGLGAAASSRSSESEQEIARALLTPDECMRLAKAEVVNGKIVKAGDMLVFAAGSPPVYGRQPLFFMDPTLRSRSMLQPAAPGFDPTRSQARRVGLPAMPALQFTDNESSSRDHVGAPSTDERSSAAGNSDAQHDSSELDASGQSDSLLDDPEFAAMAALGLEDL